MRRIYFVVVLVLSLSFVSTAFSGQEGNKRKGWCSNAFKKNMQCLDPEKAPAENFHLLSWKITMPLPNPEQEGKVLEIEEQELNGIPPYDGPYYHEDWFFTDPETGAMVFRAPNNAPTTANSSNARSELREMLRMGNTDIGTKDALNNWVLDTHPEASEFGGIGGRMSAVVAVDWVSTSGDDSKFPTHSVVIGQIHGSGKTEPLKIFFRKMPNHDKASLFWNYEIRPENEDDRVDVHYNVWGDYQLTKEDQEPEDGLRLGELFYYDIDVQGTMMYLTFMKSNGETVEHEIDLTYGHPDYPIDTGYDDDILYFKAGAYNQCNTGTENPVWGTGCTNLGIEAGDFAQVSFFRFKSSH